MIQYSYFWIPEFPTLSLSLKSILSQFDAIFALAFVEKSQSPRDGGFYPQMPVDTNEVCALLCQLPCYSWNILIYSEIDVVKLPECLTLNKISYELSMLL